MLRHAPLMFVKVIHPFARALAGAAGMWSGDRLFPSLHIARCSRASACSPRGNADEQTPGTRITFHQPDYHAADACHDAAAAEVQRKSVFVCALVMSVGLRASAEICAWHRLPSRHPGSALKIQDCILPCGRCPTNDTYRSMSGYVPELTVCTRRSDPRLNGAPDENIAANHCRPQIGNEVSRRETFTMTPGLSCS